MRVVRSYGHLSEAWLAEGMSERHLTEPLAREARIDGASMAADVRSTRGSELRLLGLGARMPSQRRAARTPRWHGWRVGDESLMGADAAVMLLQADQSHIWRVLRRRPSVSEPQVQLVPELAPTAARNQLVFAL
jgi:hypothetical protein